MPQITCAQCGKEFYSRSTKAKYCNRICYVLSMVLPAKTCPTCNKPFRATHNYITYCSPDCFHKSRRGAHNSNWTERASTCLRCGKTYVHRPRHETEPQVYCSASCYHADLKERQRGENNNFWKGGKTQKQKLIRNSKPYEKWRKAVFERDAYTCRDCKRRGVYLQAHHLYPFADFPHLHLTVSNGRTLCKDCHAKTKGREYEYLKELGLDPKRPLLF